jgi:predicted acylesterase/phospholipase RssA
MSSWTPLQDRYATKRPRKLLALDGGGIRGMITLEFLAKIEQDLKNKLGKNDSFRLCDYFDYIAGTSTGAIIATGLSLGMSVQELIDFYKNKGKDMFDKNFLLKQWKAFYESGPLLKMLKQTFGDDTDLDIQNGKLKTLLLVVTMNRTTDSPWPISNNPFAKYNDPNRPDCNLKIKLYQLVRASTAAPAYFPPETLQWDPKDPKKTFVFVDGGVTPYNNPAFLLYRMATQPAFNLGWETGEDKLLLVSVGTGAAPSTGEYNNLVHTLKGLPTNLMYTMQVDQDINCRTVGRCTFGAPIDREMGDLVPMDNHGKVAQLSQNLNRHFLYVRYNVELSRQGLDEIGLEKVDPEPLREMDSVEHLDMLSKVGKQAANKQVSLQHFGSFVP